MDNNKNNHKDTLKKSDQNNQVLLTAQDEAKVDSMSARVAALNVTGVPSDDTGKLEAASTHRRNAVIAALLLCVSLCLIGFSIWGLINNHDTDECYDGAIEHVLIDSSDADGAEGESSEAVENKENSDRDSDANSNKDKEPGDDSVHDSPRNNNSDNTNQSNANGNTSSNVSGDTSSNVSGSGSNNNAGNASQAKPEANPNLQVGEITITVSVDASNVGGVYVGPTSFTFAEGANAYDALAATGVSINSRWTSMGLYVAGINGVAEKEHGSMSGWMYYVNGQYINHSCDKEILKNGDVVEWFYVTGD